MFYSQSFWWIFVYLYYKSLHRILLLTFVGGTIAQDYQDYQENTPRPAPLRLRQNIGVGGDAPRPTPVPILKQINKHNEDGSYTYGYEGADGSFKIETKLATGEVKGKYGYVDETGKVRVVEYGANKYGFQPSGEGITVAPPTLVDESTSSDYEDEPKQPQRTFKGAKPQYRPAPILTPRPQPQYAQYEDEEEEPQPPRRVQTQPNYPSHQQPGPVQPRIQISGAQRTTDVFYSPQQRPARPEVGYSQTQSFGDGPSNIRVSRPIYASAPSPAPLSARSQGFTSPPVSRASAQPLQFGSPPQTRPVQQPNQFQSSQPLPQQAQHYTQGGSSSLLDQLAKDYALPQGNSQPLHDISFGYY